MNGGKGDNRRPGRVRQEEWDRIFGKKKTITLCAMCEVEVSKAGCGDESLDFCDCCEHIVEGNTITKEVLDDD